MPHIPTKLKFTVLGFHYFIGNQTGSHPSFDAILNRLNTESVRADQGIFILRTVEDASLISEATDYLQASRKPYVAVEFDPMAESGFLLGCLDPSMKVRLDEWLYQSPPETKEG